MSTVGDTKVQATHLGHSQEERAQPAKVEAEDQQDQQPSEQMQTCLRPYGNDGTIIEGLQLSLL